MFDRSCGCRTNRLLFKGAAVAFSRIDKSILPDEPTLTLLTKTIGSQRPAHKRFYQTSDYNEGEALIAPFPNHKIKGSAKGTSLLMSKWSGANMKGLLTHFQGFFYFYLWQVKY
ncbi:hypothetical protein [Paenibacillus polymyxa]|uniref:hypothetical protein n=1 Tax=Paenibacillus polymyxa TaxID=1406 RepID=UPI00036DC933|nr:hypothetical protein [Paenibacillus polymyxa]NMP07608.1 hypothetical protein [Paenibacillus polymyxa]